MALDLQSIYVLASGGSRAMEQLDTTTNNIANANTSGFKKLMIEQMSQRLDENGSDSNHLLVFPRFKQTLLDLHQGPLKQTQAPLDLAIEGQGYFVIRRQNETLLTRNGHFLLDGEGFLVDSLGNKVLDVNNKPILLDGQKEITITQEGAIYQEAEEVARLQIKDFAKIEPVGESYYKGTGAAREGEYKVHQGFLEGSNINPVLEMTTLITAQRKFEMYNNIIKSIDELNQKTNEIGKA